MTDDGGRRRLTRRRALQMLASTPVAALAWTPGELLAAHRAARETREARAHGPDARAGSVPAAEEVGLQEGFEPQFFTPHEYRTVRILVDLIIPADERSGSATDAGVPEFMDFMMLDRPLLQVWMRGGLAWLDFEALTRFDRDFVDCDDAQQRRLLDDIAWPEEAPDHLLHGVAFFNRFRDLTASGFWTSKMGMEDLRYMGNRYLSAWNGCPPEVLAHLGLDGNSGTGPE